MGFQFLPLLGSLKAAELLLAVGAAGLCPLPWALSPALGSVPALLALRCCVLMLLCPCPPHPAGGHQRVAGLGLQLPGVTKGW